MPPILTPTPAGGGGGASQADIDAAVAALVDSSPGALDTLNELAAALGDDDDFAGSVATALAGAVMDTIEGLSGTYEPLVPSVFLPAGNFAPVTGSPVLGDAGTDVPGYLMDAATSERVATVAMIPSGWATYTVQFIWTNAGAGSGNVVWQLSYSTGWGDGESAVVTTSPSNVTAAAPVQDTAEFTTMATDAAVPTAGELTTLRVTRLGADAADTLANDAGLIGVRLIKAS